MRTSDLAPSQAFAQWFEAKSNLTTVAGAALALDLYLCPRELATGTIN